jgi:hypothetical protein
MLTLEFQELKVQHNDHIIVVIEVYNIYQLHQWHSQVQDLDQMVVVLEAAICLAHGQAEVVRQFKHKVAGVVVVHQGQAARYTCCITRKI